MSNQSVEVNDALVNALAGAITQGIAATAPKKVSAGQYDPRTPWQPNKKLAHKLKCVPYQNGYRVPVKRLTNTEIDLFNQIQRPGRYINRMVECALWEDNGVIHLDLRYNNKSKDQRFENKNHWRNLTEMLQKIVEEQNVILEQKNRTERAVNKMIAQEQAEENENFNPQTRIESVAPTPRQEAAIKRVKHQSFSSAATRAARAAAEAKEVAEAKEE